MKVYICEAGRWVGEDGGSKLDELKAELGPLYAGRMLQMPGGKPEPPEAYLAPSIRPYLDNVAKRIADRIGRDGEYDLIDWDYEWPGWMPWMYTEAAASEIIEVARFRSTVLNSIGYDFGLPVGTFGSFRHPEWGEYREAWKPVNDLRASEFESHDWFGPSFYQTWKVDFSRDARRDNSARTAPAEEHRQRIIGVVEEGRRLARRGQHVIPFVTLRGTGPLAHYQISLQEHRFYLSVLAMLDCPCVLWLDYYSEGAAEAWVQMARETFIPAAKFADEIRPTGPVVQPGTIP